jgi:hypothetical protein
MAGAKYMRKKTKFYTIIYEILSTWSWIQLISCVKYMHGKHESVHTKSKCEYECKRSTTNKEIWIPNKLIMVNHNKN